MKRVVLLALSACVACGGGLVDHSGIDPRNATLTCTAPLQNCGGPACISIDIDPNNCGGCGVPCPASPHASATCISKACQLTCDAGFFRCASQTTCCQATALAAGGDTSCAIVDGTVQCWGANDSGQLGFNPADAGWSGKPVVVPGIPAMSAVAVGLRHVCAIAATGDVWCWGANDSGQLADVAGRGPGKVTGAVNAISLALGDGHTCANTGTGLVCWGANNHGQLGHGTIGSPEAPGLVGGNIGPVGMISAGAAFTCAATPGSGSVYCWGDGSSGQFGNGATPDSATPVVVNGVSSASIVACGNSHACAIGSQAAWCWGADASGQVGDGKEGSGLIAKVSGVSDEQNSVAVAGGLAHTCTVSSSGAASCWGANDFGQLGTGNLLGQNRPAQVSSLATFQRIALGTRHSCAQTTDGAVYCWGNNSNSQSGAPRGGTILSPRLIDGR